MSWMSGPVAEGESKKSFSISVFCDSTKSSVLVDRQHCGVCSKQKNRSHVPGIAPNIQLGFKYRIESEFTII